MRFFYLIIFLYCGNVVFGQPLDSINLAEEVFEALEEEGVSSEIFLKLKLPKPDKGFFTNYKYNHFNELFPNEKMESLSFKTIKITKSQKVESLKDEYSTLWAEHFYHLNQNGRVSSFWEGKDYSAHYIWEADKLIKSRNDDHYGDKPFTNFSKYYEYSENEIHIISKGFDEENLIYKLNEEGKVIQLLAFDFREELVKKFNYTFNEDFNIIVAELYSYGRYEGIDTIHLSENGKPILSNWFGNTESQFSEKRSEKITYEKIDGRDRITEFERIKSFYVSNQKEYFDNGRKVFYADEPPSLMHEITTYVFKYNSDGLLIRIILNEADEITEYEVSYLKN